MFSVDNFYHFFRMDYGVEKTNNLVLTFQPHGSKQIHNLEPFGPEIPPNSNGHPLMKIAGRFVMHDQEPFSLSYLDTYRYMLCNQKKLIYCSNERQAITLDALSAIAPKSGPIELLNRVIASPKRPIFCHSERNSDDIKILETSGFITCYYWWHGMIARDWFRHWEHYDCLQPKDKSLEDQRFVLYARAFDGTRTYRKTIIDHCQKYKSMIRYRWEGEHVDSDFSAKIDMSDSQSPLHIIAETLFDTNKIYLTEKVFKPMVMSQAFLLFGPPGSLVYLRDYGFQTFDRCWDESYDQEVNPEKRMSKLLNLIDDLATMPKERFKEIYQTALPVIKHNRKRFFDMAFQDDLILEMRHNVDRALFKQNQGHEHGLDDKSHTNGHDV